jgi:hypothetical protein
MRRFISVALTLSFLWVSIGLAQQPAYQPGKLVSMQKRQRPSPTGGSDAPTKSTEDVYDVTVETGGKTYQTVYHSYSALDPTWKEGKDVEVQVAGKILYVKVNGKAGNPIKLAIVSSK